MHLYTCPCCSSQYGYQRYLINACWKRHPGVALCESAQHACQRSFLNVDSFDASGKFLESVSALSPPAPSIGDHL